MDMSGTMYGGHGVVLAGCPRRTFNLTRHQSSWRSRGAEPAVPRVMDAIAGCQSPQQELGFKALRGGDLHLSNANGEQSRGKH